MRTARLLRGSAVPLARVRRSLGQGSGVPERGAIAGDAAVTGVTPIGSSPMRRPPGGALRLGRRRARSG
ncbi:hypothetical protein BVI1335_1040025 [Burkholderia vietnamiensis]|nr:hypothetical protein BVI1335_1040025 [Burkholderia vietnamiensis]